jgi:hypothetical protein
LYLRDDFVRDLVEPMRFFGMLGRLLQSLLFGFGADDAVAVEADVAAADDSSHGILVGLDEADT